MGPQTIEAAAASGVNSLFGITPLITVLVLTIIVLLLCVRYLAKELKEANAKVLDALVANTAVQATQQEMFRAALQKPNA